MLWIEEHTCICSHALDREKRKKSSRIAPIYTEAEEKQSTNL